MSVNGINNHSISTMEEISKRYIHEMTGRLHLTHEVQTFGSGFQVRNFVILTEGYVPEPISLRLTAEDVGLLDDVEVGSLVRVVFNIRGREWEGKHFNNLEVNQLEVLESPEARSSKTISRGSVGTVVEEKVPF